MRRCLSGRVRRAPRPRSGAGEHGLDFGHEGLVARSASERSTDGPEWPARTHLTIIMGGRSGDMGSSGGSEPRRCSNGGPRSNDDSLAPRLRSVPGLARRVVDIGVAPDLKEQLALRVRVCNGLAATNGLFCLAVAIPYALDGQPALALGLSCSAASWTGVLAANHRGWHRLSRAGLVSVFLANIVIYVGLLGAESGLSAMCFAVALLGCFLFAHDEWPSWMLSLLSSASVYFFSERALRALFGPAPMAGEAMPTLCEATTFLELAVVAHLFAHELRRSFRALRRETSALETARAEARVAGDAKAQFLATMSHELRTPLNGVIGMTQILSLSRLDSEQREHLRTLAASSEYLMSLLDGVLDLNKLEADRVELDTATFQLSAAVESVTNLLSDRAKLKGLALEARIDQGCRTWVSGDQRRLQQILFNLLGNAIKFTDRGRVEIRLARAQEDSAAPGSSRYEFSVEDSGIGMSDAEVQQLFRPFRLDDTTIARRFGGNGLGFAISRGLIELMGGTLQCTSRPGVGTRVLLALDFEGRPAPEMPVAPPPVSRDARRQPLGLRVLLAEDNVVNQKVVSAFLKVLGCECEVASDGLQAITRLEQRTFDVVLMDCQMPELDGVAAARRIRQSGAPFASIPIIALTANVLDDERKRCQAAGMDGYLTKPLARAKLHDELVRLVSRRSSAPNENVA
jgi:signal transduction histidine kinase/CheY-like chemotaxis protein